MTLVAAAALFLTMVLLAALPSASVLLVVTQSTAGGLRTGLAAAIGIVAGDVILMTVAIVGMASLAQQLGGFFVAVKSLAALYLIWFGLGLVRSARRARAPSAPAGRFARIQHSLPLSFCSGLLLTLGDLKAIIFYASLLPAFVALDRLSAQEIGAITVITILAVGGVKCAYALAAASARRRLGTRSMKGTLGTVSGGVMAGTGAYLLLRD